MLSQIGDIAGGGNFILASHQREESGLTLNALPFHLLTFKLRHRPSFISSFADMCAGLKEKIGNTGSGNKCMKKAL